MIEVLLHSIVLECHYLFLYFRNISLYDGRMGSSDKWTHKNKYSSPLTGPGVL